MADNQAANPLRDDDGLRDDDPLQALARLMDDMAPTEPVAQAERDDSSDSDAVASVVEVAPTAVPSIESDLEAQLMDELGFGPSDDTVVPKVSRVDEGQAQTPEYEAPVAVVAEPAFAENEQTSLEDELNALLGVEAHQPDIAQYDTEMAATRDLASVVDMDPPLAPEGEAATAFEQIEDVLSVETMDEDTLDPYLEAQSIDGLGTTTPVDHGAGEVLDMDGTAIAPEVPAEAQTERVEVDDEALLSDFDALFADDIDDDLTSGEATSSYDPNDAGENSDRTASDAELFAEVPEIFADGPNEVGPIVPLSAALEQSDDDPQSDQVIAGALEAELDDEFAALLDDDADQYVSDDPQSAAEQAPETPSFAEELEERESGAAMSPLDELEAIMAGEQAAGQAAYVASDAMPVVDTQDVETISGIDETFTDFDVPSLPDTEPVMANARSDFDYGDFDLDVEQLTPNEGATGNEHATADEFESLFVDSDFEQELAKDIEFAAHDQGAVHHLDDDVFGDGGHSDDYDVAPADDEPKGSKRGFMVAGAVAAIALIGAVGVFALNGTGADNEGPIVVEADPTPVRVQPENPGGSTVPNQDRAVFDAESDRASAQQTELVSTSEEPVDIATSPGTALPTSVAEKADDRLSADEAASQLGSGAETITSLTPRRVRTLVVRPDGTLVEQDVAVADAGRQAVEAAEDAASQAQSAIVGAAQSTAVQVTEAAEATAQAAQAAVSEAANPTFTPPSAEEAVPVQQEAVTAPVRTVTTQPIRAPIIADRPVNRPVTTQQVAAAPQPAPQPAAQVPAAQPVTTAPAAPSPFAVQIASVPSREGAQNQAIELQRRYANLLGGRGITIQQAQIEGRGTFYRVRVSASSSADATQLCQQYQRAGGNCFVTR